MNYLWAGMILIGIIFGAFNGRVDHLRCIYGQNTGDYGRCPRLIQGGGDTLHYDDRDYVVLVWDHGDCGTGRDHRKCGKKNASGDPFSFS